MKKLIIKTWFERSDKSCLERPCISSDDLYDAVTNAIMQEVEENGTISDLEEFEIEITIKSKKLKGKNEIEPCPKCDGYGEIYNEKTGKVSECKKCYMGYLKRTTFKLI